jgi:HSP20 family protein
VTREDPLLQSFRVSFEERKEREVVMAEAQRGQREQQQTQPVRKEEQRSEPQKKESRSQPQGREPGRGMEPYRGGSSEIARPTSIGSPFSMMERLMGDMGRLFEDFTGPLMPRGEAAFARSNWIPQVDVFEREGNLIVHADLPGMKQEDVSVNVDNGVLTVSGERSHKHEHESGGVYRCERSYGSFQRSLALPEGVNPESIQASFENGVLEVTMPMPEQQAPKGRAIPIQSSASSGPQTKH